MFFDDNKNNKQLLLMRIFYLRYINFFIDFHCKHKAIETCYLSLYLIFEDKIKINSFIYFQVYSDLLMDIFQKFILAHLTHEKQINKSE